MFTTYFLFGLSLAIILVACELFSNSIEWFGQRLNLGEGAVGSILAAIGTALPETIIPILAILFGASTQSESIGVGAIIGSSFMLATLAMFVVGTGIFVFSLTNGRSRSIDANISVISRDLSYFLSAYGLALLAAIIPYHIVKIVIAMGLLGIYIKYLHITITDCGEAGCDLKPLHFHRKSLPPRWRFILLQIAVSLAVIIYGAHLFIDQVIALSNHFAISALVLSLLITPIATELPEKFNSLLWVRNKKDTLAMGNITGAMVFQSTILPTIGILFTPWQLNEQAIVAALMGMAASLLMLSMLKYRKKLHVLGLLISGSFYLGYIIYVLLLGKLGKGYLGRIIMSIVR
ncbi:MAG: sodium:calcium antiporter [Actinomycetota bacterium]